MKNIDHEQKKRQERIISLQLSIKNKEDALQKRMDRVKRQSEMLKLLPTKTRIRMRSTLDTTSWSKNCGVGI